MNQQGKDHSASLYSNTTIHTPHNPSHHIQYELHTWWFSSFGPFHLHFTKWQRTLPRHMHIDIAACGVRQTVQTDGRGGLGCALVFPTEFIGCWQPEGWAHPVCTSRRSLVRYTDHKIGNTLSYKKEKNATLASHYNTVRFNHFFHNDHN